MRRIALVASGAGAGVDAGAGAESWLRTVPGVSAVRLDAGHLQGPAGQTLAALNSTDAVWFHGAGRFVSPALLEWIRGGGRVLATLEAAMLPFDLGLEPEPPDDQLDAVWRDPPALLGLAGAGPHPLFAGTGGGAFLWAAATGEPYRWCAYRRTRPERGRVVGVLWQPGEVDPRGALAWEYAVGDGGILCLGALAQLEPADPARLPELHQVLRNALAGEAIPHRDRREAAVAWPGRRSRVPRRDPALVVPELPQLDAAAALEPSPSLGGRRFRIELVAGDSADVRLPGLSIMCGATAGGGGAAGDSATAGDSRTPGNRAIARGGATAPTARWRTAHELPVAMWEVVAPGAIELRWMTSLAPGAPLGLAARGELCFEIAADASRARVATDTGATAIFAAIGGRLAATADGESVAFGCVGQDRVVLLVVGAEGDADLERTLRLAARDGWAGLLAGPERHRSQLLRTAVELEAPDPGVADALRRAVLAADARLAEFPRVGRVIADRPGGPQMTTEQACRAAEQLLAAGHRTAARDLLRSLAAARDFAGRVPDRVYESGFAEHLDGSGERAAARLARRYAEWTGDAERVATLVRGSGETEHGAGAEAGAGPGTLDDDVAPIRHVIEELWGIEPDAVQGGVAIRPRLRPDWRHMRLARLRVGATTLELDCRRRPGRIVLRVRRVHGPALTATVGLGAGCPSSLAVDEIELGGREARFVVEGTHEVDLRL